VNYTVKLIVIEPQLFDTKLQNSRLEGECITNQYWQTGDCYLCDIEFLIVIFRSISMVVILVHDNYSAAHQPCRSIARVKNTSKSMRLVYLVNKVKMAGDIIAACL